MSIGMGKRLGTSLHIFAHSLSYPILMNYERLCANHSSLNIIDLYSIITASCFNVNPKA